MKRSLFVALTALIGLSAGAASAAGEAPPSAEHGGKVYQRCAACHLPTGAGVPGGQVIGATDANGAYPTERPISIEDLGATLYKKLGIDATHEYHTVGRPVKINDGGTPIRELFA